MRCRLLPPTSLVLIQFANHAVLRGEIRFRSIVQHAATQYLHTRLESRNPCRYLPAPSQTLPTVIEAGCLPHCPLESQEHRAHNRRCLHPQPLHNIAPPAPPPRPHKRTRERFATARSHYQPPDTRCHIQQEREALKASWCLRLQPLRSTATPPCTNNAPGGTGCLIPSPPDKPQNTPPHTHTLTHTNSHSHKINNAPGGTWPLPDPTARPPDDLLPRTPGGGRRWRPGSQTCLTAERSVAGPGARAARERQPWRQWQS